MLRTGALLAGAPLLAGLFQLPAPPSAQAAPKVSLAEATEDFERQIVFRMLERVRWNVSEAARLLGVHRNSLKMKLARWGLRRPEGAA